MRQQELQFYLDFLIRKRGYPGFSFFFEKGERGEWQLKNRESIPDIEALIVTRRFELSDYLTALLSFCRSIPREQFSVWYHGFTKSIFMFGQPDKIKKKFPGVFRYANADYGFCGPEPSGCHKNLSKILKLFSATKIFPRQDLTLKIGAGGQELRLLISFGDLPLERYLVHLTHTLVEIYFQGLLDNCLSLNLCHLDRELPLGDYPYLRIHLDEADRTRLRLFSVLMSKIDGFPL